MTIMLLPRLPLRVDPSCPVSPHSRRDTPLRQGFIGYFNPLSPEGKGVQHSSSRAQDMDKWA